MLDRAAIQERTRQECARRNAEFGRVNTLIARRVAAIQAFVAEDPATATTRGLAKLIAGHFHEAMADRPYYVTQAIANFAALDLALADDLEQRYGDAADPAAEETWVTIRAMVTQARADWEATQTPRAVTRRAQGAARYARDYPCQHERFLKGFGYLLTGCFIELVIEADGLLKRWEMENGERVLGIAEALQAKYGERPRADAAAPRGFLKAP